MNLRHSASIIITLLTLFLSLPSLAKAPHVVASIPPVYALVAEITKGVTEPSLLVHGNASPHHYTLTPRDASVLSQADIVFYIGDGMENFLKKPLHNIGKHAIKLPLAKAKDVVLLPAREHTLWAGQHDDDEKEHHHHGHYNMHIWLDPNNAKAMMRAIATQLEEYDPEHKKIYAKNASEAIRRLEDFDQRIKQQLAPYKNTPFIVFHDAYPYFEQHYGLHSTGALMLSPEVPLGANTLDAITKAVRERHVACLFSEPNYDPKRMEVIASHTGARLGVLDPLETSATVTEAGYGALLEQLATSLVTCLGKE